MVSFGSLISSIFSYLGTFHLHLHLQTQINSLDLHLRGNLGLQIHMMALLSYHLQESPGE